MNALDAVVLVFLWAAVLVRLPGAAHDRRRRILWLAFTAMAIAVSARTPTVAGLIDQHTGWPGTSVLVGHAFTVLAATGAFEFVTDLRETVRIRLPRLDIWLLIAAITVLALTVLFFQIPPPPEGLFIDRAPGQVLPTLYLVLFTTHLGFAMGAIGTLHAGALITSRRTAPPWIRTGFALNAAGGITGIAYATSVDSYLLYRLTAPGLGLGLGDTTVLALLDPLEAVAILLIAAGHGVPAIPAALGTARQWLTLLQLRPLWAALTKAHPDVVFGERPSLLDDLTDRHALRYRLIRRTIEIRDATLHLRGHVDDDTRRRLTAAFATIGCPRRRAAATEAAFIRLALHTHHLGRAPAPRPDYVPPGGHDPDTEAAWLRTVSAAYLRPATRRTATAHASQRRATPRIPTQRRSL
ncbi:MAB_1171c family putative transporter [Catenuloplanes indicus]|uniref:DUF6545 domain-containing protein n=1 Tax=Catenuloplanes indicus TaxID=137267 RepID=A0AAE3W039_9ACTN|nr:MAB_1171c family putative transporter [Catenuloplanes indicus]MDQ0366924.1 hypothetical protein [Catenuloplanes indicus]